MNFSGSLFNIVLALVFAYEGAMMIVKKNGGVTRNGGRHYDKFTPESVVRFSIISGILFFALALVEGLIVLLQMEIISIPALMDEDGKVSIWVTLIAVLVFLVLYAIIYFAVLKKRDDYVEPAKDDRKQDDDEEY